MRTSIETISDVELKLTVELPSDVVDTEFAKQLKGVRKKARIKGFRPGKAPANMVKRLYADFLSSETARVLISNTVASALEEIPRQVLGDPAFEPAVANEGQALTYAVFVQVKPEVTIDGVGYLYDFRGEYLGVEHTLFTLDGEPVGVWNPETGEAVAVEGN